MGKINNKKNRRGENDRESEIVSDRKKVVTLRNARNCGEKLRN